MRSGFLLSRVVLRFERADEDLQGELSAAALTPDGSLWLGSDEFLTLERLSPVAPYMYGDHQPFPIGDFVELFNQEDEIDIEGMDYTGHYLWFTGSHSTKRGKAKGKKREKDLQALATIKTEPNRYLLARIPVVSGEPLKSCSNPDNPDETLHAAWLQKSGDKNILMDALQADAHLGPFLDSPLPSKGNGFDIEGLAVYQDKIFLGLRGPVLRGWAVILELCVEEQAPNLLTLKPIGENGRRYKKHFVDLNGLGVRELCRHGDDLIVLAGPTMDLEGSMQVFRFKDALDLDDDSVTGQEEGELEVMFDLPFTHGSDHAEGLALMPALDQPEALLVVYDSPSAARIPAPHAVYADLFRLNPE